jgi:Kef-type K+ transport system membrane component KefB
LVVPKALTVLSVVAVLAVVLGAAFLFNEGFKRVGLPPVVGQILGGLLLGVPVVKAFVFQGSASLEIVDLLATLGILFLLLLVGLEIDVEKILRSSREGALIALSAAVVPLLLGFVLLRLLGYSVVAALIFGGALSVTAEGTTVKVLMDANALNTRLGAVIVSAGAIDDVFEVLFLSMVTIIGFGGSVVQLIYLPVEFLTFIALAFILFKLTSRGLRAIEQKGDVELFSVILLFVLIMATLSDALQMGYLIGAIASGFLLQLSMRGLRKRDEEAMVRATRLITLAFVVPFFFVNIGLNFDYGYLLGNGLLIGLTVLVAFLGKILGTLIVKPLSRLSVKQLYLVGWGMNSRGAVELVIALLALRHGLIPQEVFAALVAMAVITTLVFPFVLQREIRKDPRAME